MASNPHASASCPTILVVDDDDTLRGAMLRVLREAGYAALAVANGRAALKRLKECAVELVLTDIYMPEMDGVELITKLRESMPHIPVIAITGGYRGTPDPMREVVQLLGAERVLEKPFSLQFLVESIRQVLGGRPEGGAI